MKTRLSKLLKDWGKGSDSATEAAVMDDYAGPARELESEVERLQRLLGDKYPTKPGERDLAEDMVSAINCHYGYSFGHVEAVKALQAEVERLRELAVGLALENKMTACGVEATQLRAQLNAYHAAVAELREFAEPYAVDYWFWAERILAIIDHLPGGAK